MKSTEEIARQIADSGRELLALYGELSESAASSSEKALAEELRGRYEFGLTCLDFLFRALPTGFECLGAIADDEVNLRRGPSGKTELLAKIDKGTPVLVLASEGNWVKVQLPGGAIGYVFKGYLTTRV